MTFYFETFGCQMNKSRSDHLAFVMVQNGYIPAENRESADIILFNTCAVREHASERAISVIQKTIEDNKPQSSLYPIIVIFGCLSQFLGERLKKRVPRADIIIGTQNIDRLPQYLLDRVEKKTPIMDLDPNPFSTVFDEKGYLRNRTDISTFLPITYGCDNFCSYCVVPYTTGRQRSKPLSTILAEMETIVEEGFKEITLLGQNVNSYGKDLDIKYGFETLLEAIDRRFGHTSVWIRYLTSHPRDMRPSIIITVKNSPIIGRYFHLPLQAGSNIILHSMNRGYTQEHYLQLVQTIRETLPEAGVGTDIIVGFPGETDRDFLETLQVVQRAQFDQAYTYVYSPRPGTHAFQLSDTIPMSEKKRRLQFLNDTLSQIHQQKIKTLIGKRFVILIDQKSDQYFSGRTSSNHRISFITHSQLSLGSKVSVIVKDIQQGKLIGDLIDAHH